MKRIRWVSILCLVAVVLCAQQQPDVVYLKDGSVIRGVIIENTPGVRVRIKTTGGDILAFAQAEVDHIETGRQATPGREFTDPGYSAFGYGFKFGGLAAKGEIQPFIHARLMYRPTPTLQGSFGAGWVQYPSIVTLPLYLETRYTPGTGDLRPYIAYGAGYALGRFEHESVWTSGGVLAFGTVGLTYTLGGVELFGEAGYHFQRSDGYRQVLVTTHGISSWVFERDLISYNSLLIAVGVTF